MCGRYARFTTRKEFAKLAGLQVGELKPYGETIPGWNVAPGTACSLVRQVLGRAQADMDSIWWGFIPHWSKERPTTKPINAKLETADRLPMWRRVFRYRRCLVATDGWYEWRAEEGGKQPYFVCYRDRRPFFFGGVWDEWIGPEGDVPTFAIVTQPAMPEIAWLHDRMPVIIPPENYAAWLDKDVADSGRVTALCRPPASGELMAYKVSRAVNRPANDGPELIAPVG